jgi:hypothetical protein
LLLNPARLKQLEANLIRINGVTAVVSNPGAGSMVLQFDGGRTDTSVLEAAVDAVVDSALAAPLPKSKRSAKMRINRYAKAGMIGSLATSIALAASGQKRWHAVTGGIFVACLGVHLSVYRRSILR